MNNIKSILFLSLSLLILAGCETVPQLSETNVQWESHQAQLAKIEQFEATGKIGFRSPEERFSASFNWKQTADSSQLKLFNPLGKTVLTLNINKQGATLVNSDNQTFFNKDASTLFYQLTRLQFPVEQLKDWLKGQPAQADSYALNETHTLSSLSKTINRQLWQLDYTSYQDINNTPMPYKMKLAKKDTQVQIVVSTWKIDS
ncbi:lipoprotein insertase outer membrane protein LolB [Vibrio sp. SCSIO 43137]|uniref:lipoprotein insertase outer membrane protein LolB n=1 Tax=Vibrio sp. SCSIO 43137 TaxID=3021011 RepID=UPI0023076CF8|nr:lipoprotein insertase outer membrane protein LolB [Vibrio sp. SCSIO 43137]WCE29024.1 lipoprotein insertase outer membrane protein LolB [Vibrio sp. SCSIO 43137]